MGAPVRVLWVVPMDILMVVLVDVSTAALMGALVVYSGRGRAVCSVPLHP